MNNKCIARKGYVDCGKPTRKEGSRYCEECFSDTLKYELIRGAGKVPYDQHAPMVFACFIFLFIIFAFAGLISNL